MCLYHPSRLHTLLFRKIICSLYHLRVPFTAVSITDVFIFVVQGFLQLLYNSKRGYYIIVRYLKLISKAVSHIS